MEPQVGETLQNRDFSGEDLQKIQAEQCPVCLLCV